VLIPPLHSGELVADSGEIGVRQNARLTALTAGLLLVLLFLEGLTIVQIGSLIVLHFVIGFLLLAPVALKLGTTSYKIVRYYSGDAAYVAEGPPNIVRRLLGPVVMLLTIGLFASGVALAFVGPKNIGPWLFLHKASFVLWFMAMTLHVLIHLSGTLLAGVNEYFERRKRPLAGWSTRQFVLLGTLAIGVALGVWSLAFTSAWQHVILGQ